MENLIGKTLGPYEITEEIGEGGMAHVYKAFQPSLRRFVAVKVLSPALAREPGFTERFQREAMAVARLHHPNILPVFDSGLQEDYNYLVMRLVPHSITLSSLISQNAPRQQLFDYLAQVADALHYAHQQGIIHRDIKPSNILIDGKWALLSDFGLVKDRLSPIELTGTGIGMGTPAYMSPEQARGEPVDHRTDIYAMGVILYKILTSTIPHEAPTPYAIILKRTTEPAEPIRITKPDISASLEYVTMRALARDPDQRYSTALEFAEALHKARENPDYKGEETVFPIMAPETTMLSNSEMRNRTTVADDPPSTMLSRLPARPFNGISLIAVGGVVIVVLLGLLFLLWPVLTPSGLIASAPTPAGIAENSQGAGPTQTAPVTNTPPQPTASPTVSLPGTPQAVMKIEVEVRSGPGDNYDLLGYLPAGIAAEITGQDRTGTWWQIKTGLSPAGLGWVQAGDEFAEVSSAASLPIALAPPTISPTPTLTPTALDPTLEPTATTPPPTPTTETASLVATAPPLPTATVAPTLPEGQFILLNPASVDDPTFGLTRFEWQWTTPLTANQGFEVRVWREGAPAYGVHNAVLDNQNGTIEALGNNTYRLVADISQAEGVKNQRGEYYWTVMLVQIEPEYRELGIQAEPGRLRFEPPGSSGGDDGSSSPGGSLN